MLSRVNNPSYKLSLEGGTRCIAKCLLNKENDSLISSQTIGAEKKVQLRNRLATWLITHKSVRMSCIDGKYLSCSIRVSNEDDTGAFTSSQTMVLVQ